VKRGRIRLAPCHYKFDGSLISLLPAHDINLPSDALERRSAMSVGTHTDGNRRCVGCPAGEDLNASQNRLGRCATIMLLAREAGNFSVSFRGVKDLFP
jgi:hypothetical protein